MQRIEGVGDHPSSGRDLQLGEGQRRDEGRGCPGVVLFKLLYCHHMVALNKLECLSVARFFRLSQRVQASAPQNERCSLFSPTSVMTQIIVFKPLLPARGVLRPSQSPGANVIKLFTAVSY